jgi:hypothetical protein
LRTVRRSIYWVGRSEEALGSAAVANSLVCNYGNELAATTSQNTIMRPALTNRIAAPKQRAVKVVPPSNEQKGRVRA